ncbi:MAG: flagellar biosynthetic protein FliR [Gammaproteobacteria bacterium]
MNILNLIPNVTDKFIPYILVLTRISGLFSTFIVFQRKFINHRILIALSSIIAFYVVVSHQYQFSSDNFTGTIGVELLFQFFVGFLGGLVLNIVFEMFSAFGQIVSQEIGLNMASMIDPRLGHITALTHFYSYFVTLVFLLLNGHLFVIKIIFDSFNVMPINSLTFPQHLLIDILNYSNIIFSGAIMLSMTIIVTIFLVNFTLATMSKFAPQFNVFTVGVNITLIVGLICILLTTNSFTNQVMIILKTGLHTFEHTMAMIRT